MLDRPGAALRVEIVAGVGALRRDDWDGGLPNEAEGWAYHAACEEAAPGEAAKAIVVRDAFGMVAAAPLFEIDYALDTPLQGRLSHLTRGLRRLAPGLLDWKALIVGSALAERAHLAFRPGLASYGRDAAIDALARGLRDEARRVGAVAAGFKDLGPLDARRLGPRLAAAGFHAIRSLPIAILDLGPARTEGDYLATLSASTRKDIRRKLRKRSGLRIEHRSDIADCAVEIAALYEETRAASEVRYGDFEALPPGYFERMGTLGPERARFVLYWTGDALVAFNLLLLAPDRVIDKFIGMRYPLAREHDVYAVSWMENVALTLRSGRHLLQTGQTAYADKLRFGSRLETRTIYARHRSPPLNLALGLSAGLLAFDRWDPELGQRSAP